MIREVTALLRGTELVILLVTLAYFAGYSVGYGAAGRLSFPQVRSLSLAAWGVHLTLPFSFRYLGGALAGWEGGAFLVVLFLTAFALSSFYSVLLPRFIDEASDSERSLARSYGSELAGAIAGVALLYVVARSPWATAVVYQAALALLVVLIWRRALVGALAVAAVSVYALAFPALDARSLSFSYASIQGIDSPQVLSSVNTFYQRVDILRSGTGRRYIYLSGRMNYGSNALVRFNAALSELPARLLKPRRALIVGSGSMASVWSVSPHAGHVTTVELDPAVVEGSRTYLADVNHLDRVTNWNLVINDAKTFLGSTPESFDLIVMDVPAPTTIQLGLLHSIEFYRMARARLAPGGVISVSLSGIFDQDRGTPSTVASALLKVFPQVVVYTADDAGRSFALAGDALGFTMDDLQRTAAEIGTPELDIYDQDEIEEIAGKSPALSADDMRPVVAGSWKRLKNLFVRRRPAA